MFGASSHDLLVVVLTATALYVTTLALVRIAGRRTVSQLSAFDALVTIALGSVFATSVVSSPPSYGKGAAAICTLLVLQVAVGFMRQRSARLRRLVDFSAQTVWQQGEMRIDPSPLGPQLIPEEVEAAIRAAGYDNRAVVAVVVLESNGTFSVVPHRPAPIEPVESM